MTVDKQLRRKHALAAPADAEVNVRRAPRIGDRLDRAEVVLPLGVGQKPPVTLKVLIAAVAIVAAAVQVSSAVVALPDFNEGVAKWIARRIQHAPGQMRDLAN